MVTENKKKSLRTPTSHTFADRSRIKRTTPGRAAGHATCFCCPNPTFLFFSAFCFTILLYNNILSDTKDNIITVRPPHDDFVTAAVVTMYGRGEDSSTNNNRSTVMISGVHSYSVSNRPFTIRAKGRPPSPLYDSFVPMISHKRQNVVTRPFRRRI